jgi:hypothetical protein
MYMMIRQLDDDDWKDEVDNNEGATPMAARGNSHHFPVSRQNMR